MGPGRTHWQMEIGWLNVCNFDTFCALVYILLWSNDCCMINTLRKIKPYGATIQSSGGGGAGVFIVEKKYFISTRLGGALKMLNFIACLFRTVLKVLEPAFWRYHAVLICDPPNTKEFVHNRICIVYMKFLLISTVSGGSTLYQYRSSI